MPRPAAARAEQDHVGQGCRGDGVFSEKSDTELGRVRGTCLWGSMSSRAQALPTPHVHTAQTHTGTPKARAH